jgi:hypothetical protein
MVRSIWFIAPPRFARCDQHADIHRGFPCPPAHPPRVGRHTPRRPTAAERAGGDRAPVDPGHCPHRGPRRRCCRNPDVRSFRRAAAERPPETSCASCRRWPGLERARLPLGRPEPSCSRHPHAVGSPGGISDRTHRAHDPHSDAVRARSMRPTQRRSLWFARSGASGRSRSVAALLVLDVIICCTLIWRLSSRARPPVRHSFDGWS